MRVETSSIKELPDMHRMGHTCANLNGELFFVWGGVDDKVAYVTTRNNDLWIYETITGYCRRRICSGECPPHLSASSSALINQKMYVFGGHSTSLDNWLNSLYCLDLDTFVWKDLGSQAKGEPTKPIRSDKCVSWSHHGRFYVFGGYGWSQIEHLLQLLDQQKDLQLTPDHRWPKFGWNNQLVEYNPVDNTWRWPSYTGKCPSARAAHSGALMGDKYYLFGGRDSRERLNDLYTLDMKTFEWSQIAVVSDPTGHSRLDRPIRHLLEPAESEQQDDADNEDVMDEMRREAISVEEELTPSPSAGLQESSNRLGLDNTAELNYDDDDDDEDEDGDEYPTEYPHPSHLLERWSLSSNQPASCSTSLDHPNCLHMNLHSMDIDEARDHSSSDDNSDQNDLDQQHQQSVEPIDPPAATPVGRSFSSFTPISDRDIMLYGGVSSQDENLADCWLFNTERACWTQLDLKNKHSRLWHTGARTKNNEVVIIGGSNSDKVDEFCSDVVTISTEPKSLKRLALDSVSRSIRMRSIHKMKNLPSTIGKLIKLRKQAMALTMRRHHRPQVQT